jgi:hypothetical protein
MVFKPTKMRKLKKKWKDGSVSYYEWRLV